jgi:Spy/CpxP family protein refolding chaperone
MSRLAGLVLLFPLLMSAQPPRGPRPWWDAEVAKNLNLTEAQNRQIVQTRQEFRQRMFDLRATVDKAETDVQAVFDEDPVDQLKANDAINRLAAAHSELTRAVSQMDLKLRTILTAQQWQELKQLQRPRPRGPGRRGPSTAPTSTLNQK